MRNFLKRNKNTPIGRSVRKTRYSLHIFSEKVEDTYEDASEMLEKAFARTSRVTERIKLLNLIKLLTVLTIIYVLIFTFISRGTNTGLVLVNDAMELEVIATGFIVLGLNLLYILWQAYLTLRYKPHDLVPDDQLPTCAVIVPAFNEGKQVYPTLMSIVNNDYPADKLKIITVNDGSDDDTIVWMQKAAADSNGRITVIDLPENKGKRNALYQGIMSAETEVFVTVDSDSELLKDTLKQLVSPLAADSKIGGVAGNIRVLNLNEGLIPQILDVSFVYGFEFTRSAQSRIGSVLCTPGALSAYRRDMLVPHLDGWLNEKFLGKPAKIGEDRGIANLLLEQGATVVFQRNAVAFSKMPTSFGGLCRMLIRWARSNFRENFSMMRFAFKRWSWNWLGLQINMIMLYIWMFTPMLFLISSTVSIVKDAMAFFYSAVTVITLWSTIPAFFYACRYGKNESLWAYVYGFLNFFALFWIPPYALLTIHESGWMTRNSKKKQKKNKSEENV